MDPVRPVAPGVRRSLGHVLGQTRIRVGAKPPDPQVDPFQNTDLDALNPTILFIRRETAGKGKIIFGFHPNKALSRAHYSSCGDHHSPQPPGMYGGMFMQFS